jgi:transcription termination factor Rho
VLPPRGRHLEAGGDLELRAIALLAPWARGHRALLRLPPDADGGALLARLAAAMRRHDPALVLVIALVDQRPEALAAVRRTLGGDGDTTVLGATFDEPPTRHAALAEFALQMAQREVEAGRDVVLLVDDLVHLAPTGRLLCAGLDATAVLGGKRLFAAARACEGGGSLTVVATTITGDHAADRAIAEQFERRGNSEVRFVAGALPGAMHLDVAATFTRSEDLLLPPPLAAAWRRLRDELLQLPPAQRTDALYLRLAAQPDHTTLLQQLAAAQADR